MSIIAYKEILKHVNDRKYVPVYLFYGDEKYIQEELINRLADSFLGSKARYGREKLEGSAYRLEELLSRLDESGLFSERKLLIVTDPPYLLASRKSDGEIQGSDQQVDEASPEPDAEILSSYVKRQPADQPDNILVFTVSRADRRKRLFKLIRQEGLVVECSPLKGEDLAAWIQKRAARLGKKIDRSAVERLLIAGDHSLHYLANELEKYSTYLGPTENVITAHTVDALFSGDLQGDVFKLADALAEGSLERAVEFLELLLRRREKPLMIFFLLVRHYRLLLQAHCLLEEGLPSSEFPSALEVQPFVARKLRVQAALYKRPVLEEVLIAMHNADLQIKTGRIDPSESLKLILSRIDFIQTSGGMKLCRIN